jgi:hypothetical protein
MNKTTNSDALEAPTQEVFVDATWFAELVEVVRGGI